MIHIRRAKTEDIPRIMAFLDEHWKKGHIMALDRELFEFQHTDPVTGDVTYVLAEDDDTGRTLYGTMGYVLCNHTQTPDSFTMMIRSLKNPENRMLGEDMVDWYRENIGKGIICGVGVNSRYARAIKGLHEEHVDVLRCWYRLRAQGQYRIAVVADPLIPQITGEPVIRWEELDTEDKDSIRTALNGLDLKKEMPYRDEAYIIHRYCEHPYYRYLMYAVKDLTDDELKGIVVARVLEANGARCLRIMDHYGNLDELAYCGNEIDRLMEELDCEYTDFMCLGIPDDIMQRAGMLDAVKTGNIIPDHFEPFEQVMPPVYTCSERLPEMTVYKAFADQDRPSIYRQRN